MNIAHSIICDEWLGKHIKERYEVSQATKHQLWNSRIGHAPANCCGITYRVRG